MSTLLAGNISAAQAPVQSSERRIPALDGWRGIAIILVLFDHIHFSLHDRYAYPWMETGKHGVTIFFVLSGFLITTKLIDGPINLKSFYTRRLFRLMPAALLYLTWLTLFDRLTGAHFTSRAEILSCVLFYRNFISTPGLAGHFWSLSVEEQFYLFWPVLLVLMGIRRCLGIAAVGALTIAIYRLAFWAYYNQPLLNNETQVRADALLVGSLLALLLNEPHIRDHAARWSRVWILPAFAIFLFCAVRFHELIPLLESVAIAGLITASILNPPLFKPLSALAFLGTISYSVYIWQQFFVGFHAVSWLALPLCALGSYYLVERPFVRLGRRITTQGK
jgi:peptidoglycan/LPS O-acetylase OafA/YrhL